MAPIAKLDFRRIWALTAAAADVKDPDVVDPGKYSLGWGAEIPPHEYFNFLQQLFSQGLAYVNEQGIMGWDTLTVYPIYAIVKGSDGELYRAISEQAGNDPISSPAEWELLQVSPVVQATESVAGKAELATQVETDAGTDDTRIVTPLKMSEAAIAAKAWVNFNGTGVVAIRDSLNVSSITDNGPADFTVNFSITFANTDYLFVQGARQSSGISDGMLVSPTETQAKTTTAMDFETSRGANKVDSAEVNILFFGELA